MANPSSRLANPHEIARTVVPGFGRKSPIVVFLGIFGLYSEANTMSTLADTQSPGLGNSAGLRSKLPRLSLRIGVVGHRPPKLPHHAEEAVRASVRKIIRHIDATAHHLVKTFEAYADTPPVLHIISAVAEGADSLVADVGTQCGLKVQCVLPAHRDIYRKDFESPESEELFDVLVSGAETVFELNGLREDKWLEAQAYEAAGRIVLAHSDLLIAIWDGKPGSRGGTGQMVREALEAGTAILSIAPDEPDTILLYSRGIKVTTGWEQILHEALELALRPPSIAKSSVSEFLKHIPVTMDADSADVQMQHADSVAGQCAKSYRRTYWFIYTMAPIAVICAVCGLMPGKLPAILPEWTFSLAELLVIFAMIIATMFGRKSHWHDRWLDARVLAEQFRIWSFLASMGQVLPTSKLPPYVSPHSLERDWTAWYLRSWSRRQCIVTAKVTQEFVESRWRSMYELVAEQSAHHQSKGGSRGRIHEALEVATNIIFALTAAACLLHLLLGKFTPSYTYTLLALAASTAVLPAFLSSLEGLQAQGEYRRLADRAEGMQHQFDLISQRMQERATEDVTYAELVHIAHDLSGIMLDELSDWRNLIRVRVLHPV